MPTYLQVNDLSKHYKSLSGNVSVALENLSFSLQQGEFLTVVGPSGSGKSTLLHLLAGIEKPTSGSVTFSSGGNTPRIGFVFQANTVFPWRTVEANLTYSLELRRASRRVRKEKAVELSGLIGLDPEVFLNKYPKELSGGEKRRVAIGMALAHEASLLLFDEPTSQLDYITKWNMQQTITNLSIQKGFTTILVTHDLDEAIILGDRILILEKGIKKALLDIKLPRPRDAEVQASEMFTAYREQIMKSHGLFKADIHLPNDD
jgi:NitT/TauT family transport system ATP-binding protein